MQLKTLLSTKEKERLEVLFNEYSYILKDLVNRYCFSPENRDDVFQQASLNMLDLLKSYKSEKGVKLEPYLYIFLKGRVKEISTVLVYRKESDSAMLESRLSPPIGSDSINELLPVSTSDEDRALLQMYYEEKMTLDEIAQSSNTSVTKVYKKLRKLEKELRKYNE